MEFLGTNMTVPRTVDTMYVIVIIIYARIYFLSLPVIRYLLMENSPLNVSSVTKSLLYRLALYYKRISNVAILMQGDSKYIV